MNESQVLSRLVLKIPNSTKQEVATNQTAVKAIMEMSNLLIRCLGLTSRFLSDNKSDIVIPYSSAILDKMMRSGKASFLSHLEIDLSE